jgi:hypothetical protein
VAIIRLSFCEIDVLIFAAGQLVKKSTNFLPALVNSQLGNGVMNDPASAGG